jgi:hypothetical protein
MVQNYYLFLHLSIPQIPVKYVGVIAVKCHLSNFSAISWQEQANFQLDDDDDVRFVLDQ